MPAFDFGFLNHELQRCGRPTGVHEPDGRHARRSRAPATPAPSTASTRLCTRFGVDRSQRVKHGALLDAQLLAQVYVELTGGRQIGLGLVADDRASEPNARATGARPARAVRPPRPHARVAKRSWRATRGFLAQDRQSVVAALRRS